jgi:3-mercaptopyruvate sulfurtransferase SseA
MAKGHESAYALKGGINEWAAAGYPVEPKESKK